MTNKRVLVYAIIFSAPWAQSSVDYSAVDWALVGLGCLAWALGWALRSASLLAIDHNSQSRTQSW